VIIALAGCAGVGKDTVAEILGWPVVRFADPLKEFCAMVFGWSDVQLNGPSALREQPDPAWKRPDGTCLSPREALQKLGTEWGRACHPDVWARTGIRRAQAMGGHIDPVLITDCRFINEARAVRAAGGEVWLITRPGTGGSSHASEREVQSLEFRMLANVTIENVGTKAELRAMVEYLRDQKLAAAAAEISRRAAAAG
jgi:hypothetical protein